MYQIKARSKSLYLQITKDSKKHLFNFGIVFSTFCLFGFVWLNNHKSTLPVHKVHAPFNKQYKTEELGQVLSWVDPERALSAVAYHRGLMIAPISFDFGGGIGDGAFVAYNIDDPKNPKIVFDSRNYPDLYHNDENGKHYLGDLGEHHGLYFHNDMVLLTDRGRERNGILILDLSPLYDQDETTLPKVVCRYHFPNVLKSTVYDGFTFSPAWVGGKYVYAPTGSSGLFIISTEDLDNPRLLSHLTKQELYNETIRSVHPIGDMLVLSPAAVAVSEGKIVLADVSNPSRPNLINHHTIKTGYQGIVYGSRFYNGAFAADRGAAKEAEILTYDFADPMNIQNIDLGITDKLLKPEYAFLQDDKLFIGHYPGLSKWDIANDQASFELAVEPQFPPGNDYAFVSPLGNLVIVTSDHEVKSKLNIGVHQLEPDLKSPEVRYTLPKNGAKNVPLLAKIGISFSDFIDNECLEKGAIYIQEKSTNQKIPAGFSHGMGIVHAIPKEPLKENTTYEVHLTKNLMDLVGNAYEGKSLLTTFSTGDEFVDFSATIQTDTPKESGQKVILNAIARSSNAANQLEYAWNFGDGKGDSEFSKKPSISKKYTLPGNYKITLITRKKGTKKELRSTAVQVIHEPIPAEQPISSSTLFMDKKTDYLYVVNPDNNSITAINTKTGQPVFTQKTGNHPVSIIGINDELWVSCQKSDYIAIHNKNNGILISKIELGYGKSPYGLTKNTRENLCYVALSGLGQIQEIDTNNKNLLRNIQAKAPLRNISFLPKHHRIIAPQFIAGNNKGAIVQWINAREFLIEKSQPLAPTLGEDGLFNGRGYPNYLGPIAVNPLETKLWIPGKKDNLFRGEKRDKKPMTFDHTVRSIAVLMDIESQNEIETHRIDLDNNDFASAATYNNYGNIVYIATMGTSTIWAIDAYDPRQHSVYSTYGEGACALTMNASGTKLFVHNQLLRDIAVFESEPDGTLKHQTNWKTVKTEKMPPVVLAGKRLFYNSAKRNLSREGYMSCASCHLDGGHDGRVWDLSNLGEGLRNTIDLQGKEGMKHGMLHWSGNFDELQDFDQQMRELNEGTGFLYDILNRGHLPYFPSRAGVHDDLDAIASYITSLSDYPKSPHKNDDGTMTQKALNGRQHFIELKCYDCHTGAIFTDSNDGLLHDVGTFTPNSGLRSSQPIEGFDTPTLIGLWQSAPYLHDGSAATLEAVFEKGNTHQIVRELEEKEREELIAFLMQLDQEEGITAAEVSSNNQPPVFRKANYHFDYQYDYTKKEQLIGKVAAKDKDSTQSLTYQILPSIHGQLFSINQFTGALKFNFNELYLRNISNMVLEYDRTFSIQILAKDDGDFPQKGMTNVSVKVTYPKINLTTKELNIFKKLHRKRNKNKKLNEKEQKKLEDYCQRL